ncbi:helicase associated domain-containing protein [Streptomyces sp. NPDC048508]|uniref:helicase associated domain-containing protein n=1 Tax=Streptomyces sp. NPDC048508 TaxID=3365561 RepID=UPI00371E5256
MALGANGERALAHLRTAAQMLQEHERWPRPFETVQASCRSALDALLKEAGEDFEGPRDAQQQVNKEVAGLIRQAGRQRQTPLGKLLTALDAADVPDALEPKAGLGAKVERLIRIPKAHLPVPADPQPEYEALRELLDQAQDLDSLPADGDGQRALIHAREGHLRPACKHVELVDGEETKLGAFLDNTRRRAAKLSEERRAELDELGMRWS